MIVIGRAATVSQRCTRTPECERTTKASDSLTYLKIVLLQHKQDNL